MEFREIKPEELAGNLFDLIGRQWMLIGTAGNGKANLMTASWGGAGVIWNKPSVFAFIRHSRYTHDLIETSDGFSLTFYGDDYRKELGICGSKSGRDMDKAETCGFNVMWHGEIPYTRESQIVILCKKVAKAYIGPDTILDKGIIQRNYGENDYHDMYVGEIVKVLVKG